MLFPLVSHPVLPQEKVHITSKRYVLEGAEPGVKFKLSDCSASGEESVRCWVFSALAVMLWKLIRKSKAAQRIWLGLCLSAVLHRRLPGLHPHKRGLCGARKMTLLLLSFYLGMGSVGWVGRRWAIS